MHIELAVDNVHAPGVKENQNHEYVNGTLLREPEAELESAYPEVVQRFNQQNARHKRTQKPYEEASANKAQIRSPVRLAPPFRCFHLRFPQGRIDGIAPM
jgi:hypothetical protein